MQFTTSRQPASLEPASLKNDASTRGKNDATGLIVFAFFVICGIFVTALDHPPRPLPEQGPQPMGFSAQRAFQHLAGISRAPHPVHSSEHDAVRDYIVHTLQGLGLIVQIQKATYPGDSDEPGGSLENIICRLSGTTHEKAVLLVSHYDSVPTGPGASDDGVAVAAFLENARMLQSLPHLRRDVIFLFTDGEEVGLRGAHAFVTEHPWAHDVGFVLNFEARGNRGPSIMFETSDQNGWLISNFGQAASHPVANSLSYEIYKHLPNDTDFTEFRRAGYSGLNFAFIDGLEYYHTPLDSNENVDLGSLQHHGDYVLELTRQFGNASTDDPKQPNVVYFDVLGKVLVRYAKPTASFLLGLTGVLVAVLAYFGLKNKYLRLGTSLAGLVLMFLGVASAILGAGAASWLTFSLQKQFPVVHTGLLYHSGLFILSFSAIGLACAVGFYWLVSKWISSENLMLGAFLGWYGLTIGIGIYFPGATYFFLWPLMFSVLGWIVVFAGIRASATAKHVILTLSGLPAIVLMVPMIHKIFFAFSSQSTLLVSVLLGLLLTLMIGQIAPPRWYLPLLLAVAGAGLFITAVTVSAVDKRHQEQNRVFMNMQASPDRSS